VLESRRAEDINDLAFGDDCFRDQLANSVIEVFAGFPFAARFRQRRFDSLEEADVIANFERVFTARTKSEGL
jgi:hypothetical protein